MFDPVGSSPQAANVTVSILSGWHLIGASLARRITGQRREAERP